MKFGMLSLARAPICRSVPCAELVMEVRLDDDGSLVPLSNGLLILNAIDVLSTFLCSIWRILMNVWTHLPKLELETVSLCCVLVWPEWL